MTEEKIIDYLKELVDNCNKCNFSTCEQCNISWSDVQKIRNLLDLYNKQKEEIEYYRSELELETSSWKKLEKAEKLISKDKIRNKINELTLKNRIPIKDQYVMYDCIKRNFQIEILEELLNEEGDTDAK